MGSGLAEGQVLQGARSFTRCKDLTLCETWPLSRSALQDLALCKT
jgi:hypothetical protein